jgi:hypothetical protein
MIDLFVLLIPLLPLAGFAITAVIGGVFLAKRERGKDVLE